MNDKQLRQRLAILDTLRAAAAPASSTRVTDALRANGIDLSERSVRLYLQALDREGLTLAHGHRGHTITTRGSEELDASRVMERVGLLSAKIDLLTYRMDFNLESRRGTVVVNTSVMAPRVLAARLPSIRKVFDRGFAMGHLCGLLEPGETVGLAVVPPGMVGFCTVCSVTLNGVLLKHGIPTHSRFGGLLELRSGKPTRFLELINYDGTSLDPLEIFISSRMTDYLGAISTGNGKVGASFREIPAASRARVGALSAEMLRIGIGGFLRIGSPSQPLLDIPVSTGRSGALVMGGLNPVAIMEESGERVHSRALSGLLEFERLFPIANLAQRLRRFGVRSA